MLKVFVWVFYTAGVERICNTYGCCIFERCSCVKFIITFQITFRNDVEELSAMLLPVVGCKLSGNPINL